MPTVYFVTHPDVVVDPALPIERWPLSEVGALRMQQVHRHEWVRALGFVFSSDTLELIHGWRRLDAADS